MIDGRILRAIAAKENISAGVIEKDYILTHLLRAINHATQRLVFRGGTALKKVYFPGIWRYSEDIDFTSSGIKPEEIEELLSSVYLSVSDQIGVDISTKQFRATKWNTVVKVAYIGPYAFKSFVKIDVNFREKMVYKPVKKKIRSIYPDCEEFSVVVYNLYELLAEKIRSIIQRGKTRDYYDVWLLLKTRKFDMAELKQIVVKKCEAVDVEPDLKHAFSKESFKAVHWEKLHFSHA